MVDGALAAELGLQGLDADAIALRAAVATALAHQLVDEHPLGRVDQGAALAAAAFFGGAGLVVNDDGAALDLAQLALHPIERIAVLNRNALGQPQGGAGGAVGAHAVVFVGLVGDDDDAPRPFGAHAVGDLDHRVAFWGFAHALTAGHGHRIVVQNFVGDVDPGGNALAHRQHAAVKVSAVANVGKHVGVVAEGLLAHPGHALAAHLGKAGGAAVHPQRHEVTTNAGHGARALGHAGAGVVRTARAKPGLAIGLDLEHLHGPLFGVEHGHVRLNVGTGICVHAQGQQTLGNGARHHRWGQVGMGAQQGVGAGVVL